MGAVETFSAHVLEYESWFQRNPSLYEAEIELLRALIPPFHNGLEIGVGTGLFASPLGIRTGVEPSAEMAALAQQRGIHVLSGTAEHLPLPDHSFDLALMVTTICFVDDPDQALREAHRVLRSGSPLIIAFVPRESMLGQRYLAHRQKSLFYREATFFTTNEILSLLQRNHFTPTDIRQTLIGETLSSEILTGYDRGSFVAIKAVSTA